jgi:peptidoglycan hydrolase CwlO-like protein
MKKLFGTSIKGLLIAFLIIGVASTAQAKKKDHKHENEPYLGPTVEECKTTKKGDEKCKIKKLHGQKAIEFIYQALLVSDAAIAEIAESIAALEVDTEDLQGQINVLVTEISDNDGEIATNAADISDLFSQLSYLETITAAQAEDILAVRTDLTTLAEATEEEAEVVQGQISDLQEQITTNNGDTLALLEALQGLVDSQGSMLDTVKSQITELDEKIDDQVGLLQAAIAAVQSNIDDQESFSEQEFQYATDQRTLILADILALQIARDDLNDKADDIQDQVIANATKIAELETQAAERSETIVDMQKDLGQINLDIAKKQNIISGTCPYGTVIRDITTNGNLICSTNVNGINRYTVSKYVYIPRGKSYGSTHSHCTGYFDGCAEYSHRHVTYYSNNYGSTYASCPYESIAIGWSNNSGTDLELAYEHKNSKSYSISAYNYSTYGRNLYATVTCLGLTANNGPVD